MAQDVVSGATTVTEYQNDQFIIKRAEQYRSMH